MSSKPPIGYIDIRVFAHATEDTDKVETAVKNLLPIELAETIIFQKTTLTGHHGNPIILFTAQMKDKKLFLQPWKKLVQA
jgi:RNA binding exosome subunit